MGLSDVLIMDLDPNSCPVDHCGQISKQLPKLLPDSKVVIQTGCSFQSQNLFFAGSYPFEVLFDRNRYRKT